MSAIISALAPLLPSIPYAPKSAALEGYWLPVTSTINWCEEDYYATIYSAEIVNTLTNLLFVFLALKGVRSCLRNDHDRIFLISFAGYAAVGCGSLAFHATLKYPMQLVDELSMIYTTCFSCFSSFSYKKSRLYTFCVAAFLIGLAVFITGYYHYLGDPKFHQRAYALLTATVLFRSMAIMELNLRPRFKRMRAPRQGQKMNGKVSVAEEAAEQRRQDTRDMKILMKMWAMVAYGLGVFLTGFAIWQLDNIHCGTLRAWRRELGLPWGILLEGHGWWHVMTGTGAFFFIQWALWIRHCLDGHQDAYELYWPRWVSFPLVIKKVGSPDSYLVQDQAKKKM